MNCKVCGVELTKENIYPSYMRIYKYICKDCDKKRMRDYYHTDKGKKACREKVKKIRMRIKKQIQEMLGSKCSNPYNLPHPEWCNDLRILQVDHIHGGGTKERKFNHGSNIQYYLNILRKIKAGSKDYQLLCPNCNLLKKILNKE